MPTGEPTPTSEMTLQQAADALGVHYMTAYRYVKLGLLYAEKRRGSWMISAEDLAAFQGEAGEPSTVTGTLEEALVAGDEAAAWQLVEAALSDGSEPVNVHLDLLAPALASIGQRWADGELSIASEHQASAVSTRLIARLGSHLTSPGRRRGNVIVGAAPGDVHSIPSAMFSDLIRANGVNVIDLGGSPEIGSFLTAARRNPDSVLAITVTGPGHDEAVRAAVEAVRSEFPTMPIAIGGGAVVSEDHARSLGADLWHGDSKAAAQLIAERAGGTRQSASA